MKRKIAILLFLLPFIINKANAQDPSLTSRVLVVENTNSPVSIAVGNDYMTRRGVTNVLNISCPDDANNSNLESIAYADYLTEIETPLLAYLSTHTGIDFIVFTKGIPIIIINAPQKPDGECSLDSRVASLGYTKDSGFSVLAIDAPDYGSDYHGDAWVNNFWQSETRFTHSAFGGYLVTRLDGYTQADAMALTSRSLEAEKNLLNATNNPGQILLDACPDYGFPDKNQQPYSIFPANYKAGQTVHITEEVDVGEYNSDMGAANDSLMSKGIPVLYDTTANFIGNKTNLGGYDSWGSNDTHFDAAAYHSLTFSAGAISETVVSLSARTFLPVTGAGGQSLIADLVAQGITGVKGYIAEPMLQEIASPSVLFNRYTRGWTLAESFYAASRSINWMGIVIGDPICRAYNDPASFNAQTIFYPNPSAAVVHINVYGDYSYKIYDINGRTVETGKLINQQIDIHKLVSGVYIIAVSNGTTVISKKIIKVG